MAVPRYDEFLPCIIRCLGDDKIHSLSELTEYCAAAFDLDESDRAETISSGQNMLRNRVGWAKSYLKKAGLIESPKRAHFCLSDEGRKAYQQGPDHVTLEYLGQFDSFREFQGKTPHKNSSGAGGEQLTIKLESPQERIESALTELNSELADELMAEIMKISPYEFESLVVKLLIKMGYGSMSDNADAVTVKSGDEGIDGIVSADKFGFDSIYIQAKQWKADNVVGRPVIQGFLGALAGQGAAKGIFITTSQFSKEAIAFASKQLHSKIVLVNGKQLAKLMIDYDMGVSTVATYKVKRIDSDFFSEDV